MTERRISGDKAVAAHQNIKERDYWLNRLSGAAEKSFFPYDINKKEEKQLSAEIKTGLPRPLCSRLLQLSNQTDAVLHMILTAGLVILVNKYTGSHDIILGTPIYKPNREGRLINRTVPLRNRLQKGMTFKELLQQTRQTIIEANENRDYPVELLPQFSSAADDDFLLFDIAILLENIHHKDYLQDLDINMIFSFLRTNENIEVGVQYNRSLYHETTVEKLVRNFSNLLTASLADPGAPVDDIDMMGEEEKKEMMEFLYGVKEHHPYVDKPIHLWFEEKAAKIPGNTALVFEGKKLTYGELNKRSNQLARILRQKGVGRDSIVALMLDRSFEMIVAILAILKAGGAYLPIDTQYPPERIKLMLQDSKTPFLLTREKVIENFSLALLKDLNTLRVKPVVTSPRKQISNFDALPFPDRSLVNYQKYHRYICSAMVKHCVSIQSTRGCPYKCIYCNKMCLDKYVIRSEKDIFAEIKKCYDAGARRFAFIDDVFNLNEANASGVLRKIIDNNMDIQLFFANGLRGDILSKEFIDLMIEAGTATICLALESASPRIQKLIRKNLNLERFKENLLYITQTYPQVILELELMHGFPTETEEEAMETLNFLLDIKWVHFPDLHILKIYPNTPMHHLATESGITEDQILGSVNLAYHEIPDTLPFSKNFTRQYQARFLNEYFFSKERLCKLIPYQMKLLGEDELVQKYDSYLPFDIKSFPDILQCLGISKEEIGDVRLLHDEPMRAPDFSRNWRSSSPPKKKVKDPLKVLLLDLSLSFTNDRDNMLYDVVEAPLGLMYLMTYLNEHETLGEQVCGKVYKSRIDFDSFEELKKLVVEFNPHLIGIRTLSIYKEFFHHCTALIRQWQGPVPVVAGGPYASSEYISMLQDDNIDLAVLGEGELTFAQLLVEMIENNKTLPGENRLNEIPGIAYVRKEDKPLLKESGCEVMVMDTLRQQTARQPMDNLNNINQPGDLVYMIYTSGSTGKPKGVMLEHKNVSNLIYFDFNYTNLIFNKLVQFHTIGFDASAHEIFCALLSGGELYLIDKELTTDIPAFLNFVKENDIETLFLPTSFLKTIFSESHYMDIFPSCVKHIQTAGEQLVISNRFREYLQRNNIYLHNHYGPAETHVVTTFTMEPQDEIPELPSIGKPILNTSIYILDEQRHLLPIGVPGELFIGGIQVGRGYFGKDELTKERFLLNPFEKNERLYKTGDLAKWLPNGNIQFLGRKDHQVKIRGFRVEPGEIETRLLEHNQIKEAVVTAAGSDIDRYLCAYFVSQRELELSELRVFLSKTLPDYMIPSYFIQLEKISLTPNGKVDRKALPAPQLQVKDDYVPPGNREEEKLVDIWADLLGIEKSIIGIDANFFELGGHSLKATIAISRIHKTFNVTIPHVKLFSTPTIRGLAGYIRASEQKEFVSIEPVEKREYYEISSAQKRLYVIQQMDRENIAYNLSQIYVSEKDPGKERLEKTFKKLIHRHESLRTSFEIINGNPVQRVHDNTAFEVEYYDRQVTDASNNFIRAFDLSQPPLLRVGIIKTGDGNEKQKYIFMVDMHHIISDGVSQNVLINDFMVLSAGGKPARLKLHYKDYTQWQNKSYESGELEKQEKFWLKEFAGNIPQLNIPMDFKRPEVQGFQGDTLVFEIGKKDTANLKELAKKEGATLFMVLLAFYNVLLSKLSGQEDIIVGTGAAGRRHADLERIIGMFVNTLSLRNYPGGDKSFVAFLREVKEKTIQAFENQDYLFETLVEKVVNQREANRNPLFDTVFMMQVIEQSPENKPASAPTGQELTPYDYEGIKTSMFELILSCIGIGEQITFIVFYRTTLFKKQTIEMFFQQFKEIISIVLENEKILLKEIDLSKDLTLLDKTVPQYSFEF